MFECLRNSQIIIAMIFCLVAILPVTSFQVGKNMLVNHAFAADRFSFVGYVTNESIADDLRRLLPEGTPKSEVERILVEEGGAAVERHERRPNEFHYMHRRDPVSFNKIWSVNVLYYANDTVRQVSVTGTGELHPEVPPKNRSDATVFRFEDYRTPDDLLETLRIIFPLDTPKAKVEEVLVDWELAKRLSHPDNPQRVTYQKTNKYYDNPLIEYLWNIEVSYLKKRNIVSQIIVSGAPIKRAFKLDREYMLRIKQMNLEE